MNSICLLVLAVGLTGLRSPRIVEKPFAPPMELVPVVFTVPLEPSRPAVTPALEEPGDPGKGADPLDMPEVIPVVAAARPAEAAFADPVAGAVMLAPEARLSMPPPVADPAPTAATTEFNPVAAQDGGSYPPPKYPAAAIRNRYEGTVQIYIAVGADGTLREARVHKSSGHAVLDEAALDVVKNRWRFSPGQPRRLIWPCVFRLQ